MSTPPPTAPDDLDGAAVVALDAAMEVLAQAATDTTGVVDQGRTVAMATASAQIAIGYAVLAVSARLKAAVERSERVWGAIYDLLADAKRDNDHAEEAS